MSRVTRERVGFANIVINLMAPTYKEKATCSLSLFATWVSFSFSRAMDGENRELVTEEPVEFED